MVQLHFLDAVIKAMFGQLHGFWCTWGERVCRVADENHRSLVISAR